MSDSRTDTGSEASLNSFGNDCCVALIGAGGGIGAALIKQVLEHDNVSSVHAFSRSAAKSMGFSSNPRIMCHEMDTTCEVSIASVVASLSGQTTFDLVIVAIGLLHKDGLAPEKSLRNISAENFEAVFAVNTIAPALLAKHFVPLLKPKQKVVFAALSARVGSISDNGLGGWYAYRASKAALNMVLKNAAIELARRNKLACIVGLHPGTVDTGLSKPFQRGVKQGKLFTPEFSANCLLQVINTIDASHSGKVFAWDGSEVPA